MQITSQQTIVGPEDLGSKQVMVINDIDLVIPPTNISVNKEDLTYIYRTLRTKVATKVPTGHGRVVVQMSIPFTNGMLLTMHRLIIELRNSPFCYIDNRFIRESIVPDWPATQSMAFTMRSMSIRPLENTVDTWMLDLDFVWFQYAPFMYNFLFREEWQTNFITSERSDIAGKLASFSIGWDLDPKTFKRKHRPSLVSVAVDKNDSTAGAYKKELTDELISGSVPPTQHDDWSAVRGGYSNSGIKTIYDMIVAHPGIEFDLNPLPSNMMPAKFVTQPKNSRIFVRYINYLQRDALLINFNIDIVADINGWDAATGFAPGDSGSLYRSVFEVNDKLIPMAVFPLDSALIPIQLRNKWIDEMLKHNSSIRFIFNTYKEIRFPQRYYEKTENLRNQTIAEFYNNLHLARDQSVVHPTDQSGGTIASIPILKAQFKITSPFGEREDPNDRGTRKFHWGVDLGAPEGTPIYAPEDATNVYVLRDNPTGGNIVYLTTANGSRWGFIEVSTILVQSGVQSITAGQLIATTGGAKGTAGSGNSTGPHLHVEYRRAGATQSEDPVPVLVAIYNNSTTTGVSATSQTSDYSYYDTNSVYYDPSNPNSSLSEFEPQAISTDAASSPQQSVEDQLNQATLQKAEKDLDITEDEAKQLKDVFSALDSDGWRYYEGDTSVVNVWYKTIVLDVVNSGNDILRGLTELPETFIQEGVVLTNISCGLSHIVANIPILGSEYPTQQHLGSIEPMFHVEFAVLDDQSNLEGLSQMAQLLKIMESQLQFNARKYRFVPDSWCAATDTFLTRLMGSFEDQDCMKIEARDGGVDDLVLKKRISIARSSIDTVEGAPGTSMYRLDLEETNTYDAEQLLSSSGSKKAREEIRREVIQAIWQFSFDGRYQDLKKSFQAAVQGINTDQSQDGVFTSPAEPLSNLDLPANYDPTNIFARDLGLSRDSTNYGDSGRDNRETGWFSQMTGLSDYLGKTDNIYHGMLYQPASDAPVDVGDVGPVDTFNVLPSVDSSTFVDTTSLVDYLDTTTNGQSIGVPLSSAAVASFADAVTEHPTLSTTAIKKFINTWTGIKQIILTANRLLSEEEVGGIPTETVQSELYGLPVQNNLWKSWQAYLEATIIADPSNVQINDKLTDPTSSLTSMYHNPTWPSPGGQAWKTSLSTEEREDIKKIALNSQGFFGGGTGYFSLDSPTRAVTNAETAVKGSVEASFTTAYNVSDIYESEHDSALGGLVQRYLRDLPLDIYFPDLGKAVQDFVNGILSSKNQSDRLPEVQSLYTVLYNNIYSCGNMTYNSTSGTAYWQTADDEYNALDSDHKFYKTEARNVIGGLVGGITTLASTFGSLWLSGIPGSAPIFDLGKYRSTNAPDQFLANGQTYGKPLNSPFTYDVATSAEQQRLDYIHNMLASLADQVLSDPDLLDLLGLTDLAYALDHPRIIGTECYPDLNLPTHPYFGDTFQTTPSFYMWNIYEDGGAFGPEEQAAIFAQTNVILENCYASLKRLADGNRYNPQDDQILGEPGTGGNNNISALTQMTPEGSDAGHAPDKSEAVGPMGSPFDAPKAALNHQAEFTNNAGAAIKNIDVWKSVTSSKPGDYMTDLSLSNVDGPNGSRMGHQYPARVGTDTYVSLSNKVNNAEAMFGSREGYLDQQMNGSNAPSTYQSMVGTSVEAPYEYAHTFTLDALQKLAVDSSRDIVSRKMTLDRAFPTFKLFFVEEDEFETRYINFDDFYSYNGVKEIMLTESRDLMVDHAVVTLQNVSGTLDGTKRNVIVDLDYYDNNYAKTVTKKLKNAGNQDASITDNSAMTAGTSDEQPFGAIVLRPGLNVQIRLGYSNDPDNLEVKLNGRIVDVSWNKSQDTAEIVVQGFGTELLQVIHGTDRSDQTTTYYTTHQLLGSLMFSPELKHFGRWEFGQLYQYGEAKDERLDFTDYSVEGYLGHFKITTALTDFVLNHPYAIAIGTLGLTVASYMPVGSIFKGSTIARTMFGLGTEGTVLGERGLLKALTPVAKTEGIELGTFVAEGGAEVSVPLTASQVTALNSAAFKALSPLTKAVGALSKAKEWQTVLKEAATAYLKATDALVTSPTTVAADVLKASVEYEQKLQAALFQGQWETRPWIGGIKGAGIINGFGFRPINNFLTLLTIRGPALAVGGAAAVGLFADAAKEYQRQAYRATILQMKKFFQRIESSIFLSPQDDNLYPPHPKDYMTLDRSKIDMTASIIADIGSKAIFQSTYPVDLLSLLIKPDQIISKKVWPDACQYNITSSTIKDVFQEMTLRHPGWVAYPRPYGKDFRYTMFFGVPSQRYWARAAPNEFIARVNKLRTYLGNDKDVADDVKQNFVSQTDIRHEIAPNSIAWKYDTHIPPPPPIPQGVTDTPFSVSEHEFTQLYGSAVLQQMKETFSDYEYKRELTAIPLREYLRALNIRFEPFRRYHMLTSERDIVWNGIMASEDAVYNAVDVSYYPTSRDPNAPIETTVFKAHAFIPENMLRVEPINYPNCKTYQMAMRYGMGELTHRMKDMYRGELLVLGNPRIRPHDVCILIDSYNDMVGPIEVDQVVHMFSHETGYLTEIKPCALVIGNEVSSWPIIEAMKMFSLAVKDVENSYSGLRAEHPDATKAALQQTGFINTASSVLTNWTDWTSRWGGASFDAFTNDKYKRIFGPAGADLSSIFGNAAPPNTQFMDSIISDFRTYGSWGAAAAGTVVAGGAIFGALGLAAATHGLAPALEAEAGEGTMKMLLKHPNALAGSTGVLGVVSGVGTGLAIDTLVNDVANIPSMMWLIGGPVLFLQCLRNEMLIVVPLMKGGTPIVSGLNYNDPSTLWNIFRGEVNRWFHDSVDGTRDMLKLWRNYGTSIAWRITDPNLGSMTGETLGGQTGVLPKLGDLTNLGMAKGAYDVLSNSH